jgi:hypothetical protein
VSAARWSALALVACHHGPPDAASEAGATAVVSLDAVVFAPRRVGVDVVADVVVPRTTQVTRDVVWGTADCSGERCVLALVAPGERLELHLADEDPDDAAVLVRALPPPPATPITPGTTTSVHLAEVAPGDPRGELADLAFTLDAPTQVTLDWTTRHTGAGAHGAPHRVEVDLYGSAGPEQASVQSQYDDAPERRGGAWDLGPGRYVVRVRPETARFECEVFDTPFGSIQPPAWCALPEDGGPYEVVVTFVGTKPIEPPAAAPPAGPVDVTLSPGSEVAVQPGRPPADSIARIRAVRGEDLVVRWAPAAESMGYAWKDGEAESYGACEERACRFWNVRFDEVELSLGVREAPAHAELLAVSLPRPTDRTTLDPGTVWTGPIAPVAPGDPRGPLLELDVVVVEPGRYHLGVRYPEGSHQPWITALTPELEDLVLNYLGSDPYQAAWFDADAPGVYPVRVHTCPDCPEVEVEVEWQRDE